jgi:hypothetical protein
VQISPQTYIFILENRECRKLIAESDELVRTVKGGTELTEDEWVAKLRKMKEETEKEIRESRYAEQHLREKYKDESTKIIELLRAKLKKVEEVFKESAQQELDQPKMESGTWGTCLNVPIIRLGTHVGLKICFFLHLILQKNMLFHVSFRHACKIVSQMRNISCYDSYSGSWGE